jgi:hypothetical protein
MQCCIAAEDKRTQVFAIENFQTGPSTAERAASTAATE